MVDETGIEQTVIAEPKEALSLEACLTSLTDKLGQPETSSQVRGDVRTKLIDILGEAIASTNPRGLTPLYEAEAIGRDTRIPSLAKRMEFVFAGIGEIYAKIIENQTPGSKEAAETSLGLVKSIPVPEQRMVSGEEKKAKKAAGEFVVQTLNLPEDVKNSAEKGWEQIWQALKRAAPDANARGIWTNLRSISESYARLTKASEEEKPGLQKEINKAEEQLKTWAQPTR